ncbi:MAG: 23S rRNA (uracil(1939)-C(5))-methyltransferase RlmD [Lachnospiraceae bacterium]|nr:23S rRNA (uracil(1939)-C(5))-methyltransferase RlmD [Lachnospiraceae bacterium]
MSMNKNDIVTTRIDDFTLEGEGIGHADGYTLFIKDAIAGDTVKARITRPKKGYAYARLEELLEPSPDRVPARCPEARRCGGCRLQECSYERQLEFKRTMVENVLRRIGHVTAPVLPVIGMDDPWRYRNKAQYPVANVRSKDGVLSVETGFYAGRTHSLIPMRDCVLTGERNARVIDIFLAYMKNCRVSAYDEGTGKGLVRHLLVREGFSTGELMVCPVINGDRLPDEASLVKSLLAVPGIKSICANINKKRGNVILGDRTVPLYGDPWITDRLMDLTFRISPRSFYQVNPKQTEVLYKEAIRAAALTGNETVYDLYCGIGTISLCLAPHAKEVIGVEIVPDAVRDARDNAAGNKTENARFYTGAAEDLVVAGELAPGVPCPKADVVVLDPPRKGCEPSLIRAVLRMAPERIVYVSCDPATLARDLRIFEEGDGETAYKAEKVQPVDMFPQTCHVETVCLLTHT